MTIFGIGVVIFLGVNFYFSYKYLIIKALEGFKSFVKLQIFLIGMKKREDFP